MLSWFDAQPAQAFAAQMAKDVVKLLGKVEGGSKQRDKNLAKLQRLFAAARKFSAAQHLNMYKKARLGQTLRTSLLNAGYAKDFAEEVVRITLTHL
ncbi:MAG TPA: hypothetical protein VFC24_04925 [Casimicrobiaceae bacterium]|nr:hypothetical protein [Casimicrobiaceae bacterium]